jgi:hypothetical protein
LKSALKDVVNELDDLKESDDFPELCQQLLIANHGMNHRSFLDLINSIMRNRNGKTKFIPYYSFGLRHVEFDLKAISGIISLLLMEPEVKLLDIGLNSCFQ